MADKGGLYSHVIFWHVICCDLVIMESTVHPRLGPLGTQVHPI
jgi:hypothetical protein